MGKSITWALPTTREVEIGDTTDTVRAVFMNVRPVTRYF